MIKEQVISQEFSKIFEDLVKEGLGKKESIKKEFIRVKI